MTTQTTTIVGSHTDPFTRKYKIVSKIGEGSYSEVLKCKSRDTGSIYACKRLKHCYRSWNQVNDIPEIVTLRKLARHPNILQMVEIHFDPTAGRVSLVFELMDMNLYELIKDRKRLLPESRVRVMMFQLMRALRHLHKHGIFHRDVKPENILLKNDLLKLGDLGSVRGLYSRPPYTEYISTRWYRSPECLLTCGYYSFKMDVWAAGCVFYEILTLRPLFPGSSELDQINRVHNVLGPPPQKILLKFSKHKRVLGEIKTTNCELYFSGKEAKGVDTLLPTHVTAEAKDLLKHLLQYDPDSRPSSHRALQHAYFKDLREEAQRAAREKIPTLTGPIVTIVGDERGLEVTADDNANPVDLATLGDGKLKLKPGLKRVPDMKEIKEAAAMMRKNYNKMPSSSSKILVENPSLSPKLKEAGEMFTRESEDVSVKKVHNLTTSNRESPSRIVEERHQKLEARNNLKFGGDAPSSTHPYPKMYLDEDEGDGPKRAKNHSPVHQIEPGKENHSPHLNRRRGGGSTIEVERKPSVTTMTNESSSGRSFPLDFVDKAALTPDIMDRINENRRIAHMQPIISSSSDAKNSGRSGDDDRGLPFKEPVYSKAPDSDRHQKKPRSPKLSPNAFSPRQYQQRKPFKADHNTSYFGVKRESSHGNSDGHRDQYTESPTTRYGLASHTNKQVKELLASLPSKKKYVENVKQPTGRSGEEHSYPPYLSETIESSKNQLVKNIRALRKKYDEDKKNVHYIVNPENDIFGSGYSQRKPSGSGQFPKTEENLRRKGSFETTGKLKVDADTSTASRHYERRSVERKTDPQAREHNRNSNVSSHPFPELTKTQQPPDNSRSHYTSKERQYPREHHSSQKYNHDREREPRPDYSRTIRQNLDPAHLAERYQRGIVHRHDLNSLPQRPREHSKEPDSSSRRYRRSQEVLDADLISSRAQKDQRSYETQYSSNNASGRKPKYQEINNYTGHKNYGYVDDSAASLSPTNVRRLIENRRQSELVTTDTDADGDSYSRYRKTDNLIRRKRRSRYSTLSPPPPNSNSVQGSEDSPKAGNYSPRDLLPSKYSQEEQSPKKVPGIPVRGSNSNSISSKQVRDILAEMRKRRDLLDDRVTKDTSLLPSWNNDTNAKAKLSDSTLKRPTNIPRRNDMGEHYDLSPYSKVSKSPYQSSNTNNTKGKKHGYLVASTTDVNPVRPPDKNEKSIKTGLHSSSLYSKYLESSEARLKEKSNEIPSKSIYGTGAGSKAFPRNRHGSLFQKK